MLTLHHSPFSVASQKVCITLAEKRVDWNDRIVDLLAGEHCLETFRRLNPRAEVPVLEHAGHVFVESWPICEYIDETVPQFPLMPASAIDRHTARVWNQCVERDLHHASGMLTYAVFARPMLKEQPPETLSALLQAVPDPAVRAWRSSVLEKGLDAPEIPDCIERHRAFFQRVESHLPDSHAWLAGPAFSLADIAVLPYVMRAEHLGLGDLMTFESTPHLRSWYLRMLTRPSMQPALVRYVDATTQNLLTSLSAAAHPALSRLIAHTA
ncbi:MULTISPECIES: glutathione S-transferase family protein [unclassified Caballeronia]|uniref:glutathione S-transferase family protein n=1 Tax=unclassified Caballeronia TaxID=2646786 RepID=UPI002857F1C3|nr:MULTISPECIES: glutathione S-transferase family protein [unclassified Caballeronia]MDR5753960.1 glutathione S-transferase family protein [Caballeronia sp. LZ024]MDR5840339.1 glutathione S-transferase family protein [Caballeronia sp. LZ031]